MSTLFDHVIETPEYEIVCDRCVNSTDKGCTPQEVTRQAEQLGFTVTYGDEVLCRECAEAL